MSARQISLSADLQCLVDEGYEIQLKSGCLRVLNIPYLDQNGGVARGNLAYPIEWAGDIAAPPRDHVAYFEGGKPFRRPGEGLRHIIGENHQSLAPGVEVDFQLSSKPLGGTYPDHFEKVETYVDLLEAPAQAADDSVTARNGAPVVPSDDDGVFNYWDTAKSNADVVAATEKLRVGRIAIVGVGGTGSYVLDMIAKCPVDEIHIYDDDVFLSHNAFRTPGAPAIEQLRGKPTKVDYLAALYGNMHRRVVPHSFRLDDSNADLLDEMAFVFLCLDRGVDKKRIVERLEERGTSFIDVGMGIDVKNDALLGTIRITTSTPAMREHVRTKKRIPFTVPDADNEYSQSIQIADLSALNAALAVIRWKKICGFYIDLEHEHFAAYTLDGNTILNEDLP